MESFRFAVCTAKLDIGFVVDGSSSVERYGKGNFGRILRFVQRIISSFRIGRKFARVGVVLYSSRPYKVFGLNRYGRKSDVMRAVARIRYPRGSTRTGWALRYAERLFFPRRQARRARALFVITDGRSSDSVVGPARSLRRKRVHTFAIGVGKHYKARDLRYIATDRYHIFTTHFTSLGSIVRAVKKKACKGIMLKCIAPHCDFVNVFSSSFE